MFFGVVVLLYIYQMINPIEISGNSYDSCTLGIFFQSGYVTKSCVESGASFGQETANVTDISFGTGPLIDYTYQSPIGLETIDTSTIVDTTYGSHLKITNLNGSMNEDRGYLTYGQYCRTGYGLTDTTVRTSGAGKFALRLEPNNSIDSLYWSQIVPIGDITNQTMTITVWIKINNVNYYANTYIMPALQIIYDETTSSSKVSSSTTEWQQLGVTFTPSTSYGQITVNIYGATDATGTDAYFYIDDMNIAYPAGYALNLGGLDNWANAMPVTPVIATMPSISGIWDELLTSHTIPGSTADRLKKTLSGIGTIS